MVAERKTEQVSHGSGFAGPAMSWNLRRQPREIWFRAEYVFHPRMLFKDADR
jgi:hypothetical protein